MNDRTKSSFKASLTRYLALSLGLSITGYSPNAARADSNWVGDTSADWNDAANWSSDPANPTGNFIINGAGITPVLSANSAFSPVDIKVGTGATGRLDQTAGTLSAGGGNWSFIGQGGGGNGTYNLADTAASGGTLTGFGTGSGSFNTTRLYVADGGSSVGTMNINTTGTATVSSDIYIGNSGTGVVNMDAGTLNRTGGWTVIGVGGAAGNGTLNMSGGLVAGTGDNIVGLDAGSTGALNMTGGTYTAGGWVQIGRNGNGSVTLSGSSAILNANDQYRIGFAGSGTSSTTVSAGTLNVGNWLIISQETTQATLTISGAGVVNQGLTDGGSRLEITNPGSTGTGTVNLDGGTLNTNGIIASGSAAATSIFNFNGGTLKARIANNDFINDGDIDRINVRNGGAVIDTNGNDIRIVNAILHSNIGGDNATDGGLTKNGAGTLTLSNANTYTGATTVNGGTLVLGGAGDVNSSSGIVVNGAGAKFSQTSSVASTPAITLTQGTLAGSGTVGVVTVSSTNGSVSNGTGGGNTSALTVGSLTFASAGSFSLNKANDTSTVALSVTGTLTTIAGVSLNVATAPTWSNGSTYNMISYGSLSGTNPVLGSITGLGARQSATVGNTGATNGFITLAILGDTPFWTGAASSAWTTGTIGSPKNWKLVTANTTTDFLTNDQVLFNDNATGSTSVDISTANVGVASVTFTNNTKNYTISSSGGFGIADGSGAASLVKSGTGALVITTSNSYTGSTTINAGATLALGNGTSGNDGTIANTSNVSNDGTLVYNRFGSSTAGYIISGTGSVVKNGAGTQILGGANTYSGGTIINSGTLQITTTAGAANQGTFNLNGGGFQTNVSSANYNYAPTINLTASGSTFGNVGTAQINYTGTINGNSNALTIVSGTLSPFYINGTLNNVSQINIQSGVMGFDQNTVNNRGTAPVSVANGAALWYAGNNTTPVTNDLTFNGGNGMGGGALYYEGGVPVPAALTGNITLASGTTGIGSQYSDTITLNGNITGAGALTQLNGTVILAGSNSYSGGTTINAGTLQLGNGGTSGSLSGSTAITNNSTLAFNRSDTITQGTGFGTITGTGGVTVKGGTAVFNAANTYTGTTLVQNGTLQVSGSGTINTPASQVQVGYGNTGSAVLDLQSGANVSASSVEVAHAFDISGTQTGTVNIASGATLNSEADFQMGFAGGPSAQGTVNINGGTLNVATTSTRWMIIGRFDTVNSTVNVNSGNLNLNANTDLRFSVGTGGTGTGGNGNRGTNVINLNGGAITSYSDNATTANGAGVLDLSRFGGSSANNTFNLNNGTLAIRQVITDADDSTVAFNFNGGTLKATGNNANFVDLGGASQTANVQAGGAIIDSNGFDVTIPQALLSGTAGTGGLTKTGAGTLTLTASNTYTGLTSVNNGTLEFAQPDASVVTLTGGLNVATSGTAVLTAHTGGAANVKVLDLSALTISGTTPFAGDGGKDLGGLASPAPVPEPGTIGLLAVGAAGTALLRRRNRKSGTR